MKHENLISRRTTAIGLRHYADVSTGGTSSYHVVFTNAYRLQNVKRQVAQLSQRESATHELLRFAKLRSGIFEPPFGAT